MAVGTLEEIIDDNHAIVSTSVGSEYYVNMLSFVDKDLIEPGCTVLLNNKVKCVYLQLIASVVCTLKSVAENVCDESTLLHFYLVGEYQCLLHKVYSYFPIN